MGETAVKQNWIFLVACLGLGLLAEISFLHGRIGVSYLVFIFGFYLVVFLRFKLAFNHRRIGLLLMIAIWVLSANFLFYDIYFLHSLNALVIPVFVFIHVVLIASPSTFKWGKLKFISLLATKMLEALAYLAGFIKECVERLFQNTRKETAQTYIRIFTGFVIGIPLLFIITLLLMSADTVFQNLVLKLPDFIFDANMIDWMIRAIFVFVSGLLFFGVFQVVQNKSELREKVHQPIQWNDITAITILVMMNLVYLLFVAVQFTYFFNGQLIEGFTYAEYARRGFFELILVLLINWTILINFLKRVISTKRVSKVILQVLYSVLIAMSGVMLASAYLRLSMYEEAYGFTLSRILAHVFMIYLLVIFAYTFMRVWLEKIPLLHFYLIVGLIFYIGLNAINIEKVIVDKNMERYKQTGKIDIYYLDYLSEAGTVGLIELYKKDPNIEDLEDLLLAKKEYIEHYDTSSWQSFNFSRQKMRKELFQLNINKK